MRTQTQFSIFLINEPGVLASVTEALAKAHVNITALALADSGEHGVLRVVTEDEQATREVLGEAHDRWTETEVLVAELDNRPGAFAKAAQQLAEAHINILYAYSTGGAPGGKTHAVFKVSDMAKARKTLQSGSGRKTSKTSKPVKRNPRR